MEIRLIPPFYHGDGKNFSKIKLFAQWSHDLRQDDIIRTAQGQQIMIYNIEYVEDYFESYSCITCALINMDPNAVLDPKITQEPIIRKYYSATILKPRRTGATYLQNLIKDPTKTFTIIT